MLNPTYSGHGGHGKVYSCNILVNLGCLPQIIATCRHISAIGSGALIAWPGQVADAFYLLRSLHAGASGRYRPYRTAAQGLP